MFSFVNSSKMQAHKLYIYILASHLFPFKPITSLIPRPFHIAAVPAQRWEWMKEWKELRGGDVRPRERIVSILIAGLI